MKQAITPKDCSAMRRRTRGGFGMLDLLVAFTLLVAAISVATPLLVRHGQIIKSQRNYRLALDELSNQLERLTALSPQELPPAIERLAPAPFVMERLHKAQISGELAPIEGGSRVTLRLTWDEVGGRKEPVALAAWVFAGPRAASTETGVPQP
jgi:hypothetical protein